MINDPVANAPTDVNEGAHSLLNVITAIDGRVRQGNLEEFQPISTGFGELDAAISGGFRPGQLMLLSGPAGVGKTSLLLQIARNIAMQGQAACLFICYEHETEYLAQRLISLESAEAAGTGLLDGLRLRDIAEIVSKYNQRNYGNPGFLDAIRADPRGARALERIARYGSNLMLMKGSSTNTTCEEITRKVREMRGPGGAAEGKPLVLFVDYLQKIPTSSTHADEAARNVEEIVGLKELSLEEQIVVVSIVAAEVEGLKAQRMRLQHLLASALVAYEADIIMLMNEKYDIVDRRQIDHNRHQAEQFHQYVVLSVEKNRAGSDLIDLELKKQLQFCRFRSEVKRVEETLISGRNANTKF